MEETAESLVFGIGRIVAGRDLDGVTRTGATFSRPGTLVLPKVEVRVPRRSYRAGWHRLAFRLALGVGATESGYLLSRDRQATGQTPRTSGTTGTKPLRAWMPAASARPPPRPWAASRTGC
ncbi:hypothetical protein ACWC0C_41890 [Streptomyces sp. NPDC001709]